MSHFSSSNSWSFHDYHSHESKLFQQYKEQKYCDLAIICGEKIFRAHKVILASASLVFESLLEENCSGTLILSNTSPVIFKDLLEFVYTGKVLLDYKKAKNLLEAGEKYSMFDLQGMCLCKIESSLSVSTAVEILTMFDKCGNSYGKQNLRKRIMEFIKTNIAAVVRSDGWKAIMMQRVDLMDEVVRFIHT